MRIEQLRCLADVAMTGSISTTAQRLFLSQQAVSKNIKLLEEEFGVEIFTRTHSGVQVTKAGSVVAGFAQKVLSEEEGLMAQLKQIQGVEDEEHFTIDIATASPVTNLVVPTVLAQLYNMKYKPSVGIVPVPGINYLLDGLQQDLFDLGLITYNTAELERQMEPYTDELELTILLRDNLTVVASKRQMMKSNVMLNGEHFSSNPIRCLFNLNPIDPLREIVYNSNVICSNDVEFHRSMLEQTDAMVMMPTLAYRCYFESKKYVAAPYDGTEALKHYNLKDPSPELVHAAIIRKDAPERVRDLVKSIRQELYLK